MYKIIVFVLLSQVLPIQIVGRVTEPTMNGKPGKPINVSVRVEAFYPDGSSADCFFTDVNGNFWLNIKNPRAGVVRLEFTRNDTDGPQLKTGFMFQTNRSHDLKDVVIPK